MCVTIIFHKFLKDYPIIIGNNRDELVDRKFSPPSVINTDPYIFGPKDLERGGTWIGINEYKIFANILNRWTNDKSFLGSKNYISRGQLVLDVLKFKSIDDIEKFLNKINPKDFLPFHLVVADKNKLLIFTNDGKQINTIENKRKIFIVGNIYPFDSWEKYKFGYNFLKKRKLNNLNEIFEALSELLRMHKGDKNIPSLDYAVNQNHFMTTSSSLIAINRKVYFKFLNGFPGNFNLEYIDYNVPFFN